MCPPILHATAASVLAIYFCHHLLKPVDRAVLYFSTPEENRIAKSYAMKRGSQAQGFSTSGSNRLHENVFAVKNI